MAKILMLNLPSHGHINPTLAIAKELVARGHQVTYLITEEFREKIEATGTTVICYDQNKSRSHSVFSIISNQIKVKEIALRIGHEYDCIIYEMIFMRGLKIGEMLNKPAIRLSSIFAVNKSVFDLVSEKAGIRANLGKRKFIQKMMAKLMIKNTPELNIVFTSRGFQYAANTFDSGKYKFTGPSIMERKENVAIPFNQMTGKVIYISLGTIFNKSEVFYKECIKAFRNQDFTVIMAVGKKICIDKLGKLPANFHVYPHVPQLEVLKRADAFITHGGMNSANEAIYFAVPLVVIPQRADQPMVGKRIEQLALGKMINKKKVTVQILRDTLAEVLGNPQYKINMEKMSKEMQEAGGYKQAVTEIETYLNAKTMVS